MSFALTTDQHIFGYKGYFEKFSRRWRPLLDGWLPPCQVGWCPLQVVFDPTQLSFVQVLFCGQKTCKKYLVIKWRWSPKEIPSNNQNCYMSPNVVTLEGRLVIASRRACTVSWLILNEDLYPMLWRLSPAWLFCLGLFPPLLCKWSVVHYKVQFVSNTA